MDMSSAPAGARSLSRHLPGWVMGAFLVAVVVGLLIEWLVPQASAALLPGGAVARQGVLVLVLTVAGVGLQALWRAIRRE